MSPARQKRASGGGVGRTRARAAAGDLALGGVCLAAGACGALAFDPIRWGVWATPILAMAVLLAVTWDARPRRTAALWYLFAVGHFGVGVGWTHYSLHVYGGIPLPVAVALSSLLALALAGFYAAAAWLGRRAAGRAGIAASMAGLVACWVLLEHARSWAFSGFGWLAIGYSQVPRSGLSGYIPYVGAFGATALAGMLAALVAVAALLDSRAKSSALLGLATVILVGGWALGKVPLTSPAGPAFTASVLQGSVPQERQWLQSNISRLPARYQQIAARAKGRLLVMPEAAFPFEWGSFRGPALDAWRQVAARRGGHVVIGTFTRSETSGRPRNSAVVLGAAASDDQTYSKRHLTPYGEYLPFKGLVEPLLQRARIPYSDLEKGEGGHIVELPYATLGMAICYESIFSWLFDAPPAEVLVHMTNDSWFDGTLMPLQHLQISMARALENGRWLLRASNTGPSAIISPRGKVVDLVAPLVRGAASHEITPMTGATPYSVLGDLPVLALALATLVLVWRRRARDK